MTTVFFKANQTKYLSNIRWFVVMLAMFCSAAPSAMADRIINSVSLNGGAPWTFNNDGTLNTAGATVTVTIGDAISVSMTVTTDDIGNGNNWASSGWRISNNDLDPLNCVDTNDHTDSGTFTETFDISAPLTLGTLNSAFVAYSDVGGVCSPDGQSAVVTLGESVTVLPPPPNPALGQGCGLDVILAIDLSDSIDPVTELPQIRDAAHAFVNSLLPGTPSEIGIVTFSDTATTISNLSGDANTLNAAIDGMTTTGGLTNWQDGLTTATALLEGGLDRDDALHPDLIIMLTDGKPTLPLPNPLQAAVSAANAAKTSSASLPIRILAVGIGLGDPPGTGFIANLAAISGPDVTPPQPPSQFTDVILSDFANLADILARVGTALCGGTITVHKVIDQDGNLETTDDQISAGTQVSGWTISANVPNATVTPTSGQTDEDGMLLFEFVIPNTSATVQLVEAARCGGSLIGVTCTGATTNGTFNAASHSIDGIVIEDDDIVECTFYNALVCPPAIIAPGDPDDECRAAVPDFVSQLQASNGCTPDDQLVITQSPIAGTLVGVGITDVTITVTDADNNMSTCTTSFTVDGSACEPPPPQPVPCDAGMSLLFSVLSAAPVCGSGCLMMVPAMLLGLMQMRGTRRVRRNRHQ